MRAERKWNRCYEDGYQQGLRGGPFLAGIGTSAFEECAMRAGYEAARRDHPERGMC